MDYDIGCFPRLGISSKDLSEVVIKRAADFGESRELQPYTRPYFIIGKVKGKDVIIKPYESGLELQIVQRLLRTGAPCAVRDCNETHFIEKKLEGEPAEVRYKEGILSADELGQAVGSFLSRMHIRWIEYGKPLDGHLFVTAQGTVGIDFGAASFTQLFKNDIADALTYLTTYVHPNEMRDALRAFYDAYSFFGEKSQLKEWIKRHLKFTQASEEIKEIIRSALR
jgi:tRNA A-37 threonylcarbamoyl transferase component Bud32